MWNLNLGFFYSEISTLRISKKRKMIYSIILFMNFLLLLLFEIT